MDPERRSACHAACTQSRPRSARTFSPRNRTSPEVASIRRSTQRPVVVFPLPDSPTNPNVSPSSIEKLTSSTALMGVPCERTFGRSKCLTRCATSTSGISVNGHRAGSSARGDPGQRRYASVDAEVAAVDPIGAAWMKRTARRKPPSGHGPFDGTKPATRPSAGHRCEQTARIGMLRLAKDGAHGPFFDDPACVHHRDAIGGFRDHAQVVGDEQNRKIEASLAFAQQVENLAPES